MRGGLAGRLVAGRRSLVPGGRGLRVCWRLVDGSLRRRRCRARRGKVWRLRCDWRRVRLGHRARLRHVLRDWRRMRRGNRARRRHVLCGWRRMRLRHRVRRRHVLCGWRRVRLWGGRHGVRRRRVRRGGRCKARLGGGLRGMHGGGVRRRGQVRHRRGRGRRHPGVFSHIQRHRLWRVHGLRRPGRLAARGRCWRCVAHRLGRLRCGAALGWAVLACTHGLLRTVCLPCAVPVVLPGRQRRRRGRR
jgi:hypothetical protein